MGGVARQGAPLQRRNGIEEMNTLPVAREDISISAEHFATEIITLPQMTDGKRRIVAVGRALNAKQMPTSDQRTYAGLAWRVFSKILVGYHDEVKRLEQLYHVAELDYRDEIAKALAKRWDAQKWRGRR